MLRSSSAGVEFGQFDLAGGVAGDFADGAEHPGRGRVCGDHDEHVVLGEQRLREYSRCGLRGEDAALPGQ